MAAHYQMEVVGDFRDLIRIRADWDRLASPSNVFTDFAWVQAWWDEIAQRTSEALDWFAVVVRRNHDVVAIAPLVRRTIRRAGMCIRKLQFATSPFADYEDFLLSDDTKGQVAAILECLSSRRADWDVLELLELRHNSPVASFAPPAAIPPLFLRAAAGSICPYVELVADDRDLQRRIRRSMSRAGSAGLHIQLLPEVHDSAGLLAQMIDVERKRAAQAGRKLLLAEHPGFVARLMDEFADSMYAIVLRDRRQLVSYELGFRVQRAVWMYTRAFDSAYADASPGTALQAAIVQWAMENGYREYDFLRGAEPYKFRWTKQSRCNHQLLLWHSAVRSRAAAAVFRSLSRWRNGHGR